MSEENLETFRRSLEAFDRRDKASWLEARDRDYEVMEGGQHALYQACLVLSG